MDVVCKLFLFYHLRYYSQCVIYIAAPERGKRLTYGKGQSFG